MRKKVSVVIPVYNGERYLSRCLNSVMEQINFPIEALEILVIDDGSKDMSADIVMRYEAQYPNIITYIYQDNAGVAKTRNTGISIATGMYVMFIDQDDYIEKELLITLYTKIEQTGADVVLSGLRRPDSKNNLIFSYIPKGGIFDKFLLVSAWGKLHRRSFLLDKKISFFSGLLGEDIPFTVRENFQSNNITHVAYIGYNWFFNEKSVSNTAQRGLQSGFKEQLI